LIRGQRRSPRTRCGAKSRGRPPGFVGSHPGGHWLRTPGQVEDPRSFKPGRKAPGAGELAAGIVVVRPSSGPRAFRGRSACRCAKGTHGSASPTRRSSMLGRWCRQRSDDLAVVVDRDSLSWSATWQSARIDHPGIATARRWLPAEAWGSSVVRPEVVKAARPQVIGLQASSGIQRRPPPS
jgi:hypothetical protein